MKKVLIALGALTMFGATAAAEEFRPTGSLKQEIRWYSDKEDIDAEGIRFTMAEGGIRFTENFYADYRVRDNIRYHSNEGSDAKDIRTRLYFDHGTLGDTQIDVRQRFGVEANASRNRFYYTPEFNFAEYVPGFSTVKVRPVARYQDDNNGNKVESRYGMDFLTFLPFSFDAVPGEFYLETNFYFYKSDYGVAGQYTSGGTVEDSQTTLDVEVYAGYELPLGEWNGVNFAFFYELGIDPYSFYDRKIDTTKGDASGGNYDSDLFLYNDFELQFSYDVNGSTSIYGALAVEFANSNSGNNGDTADYKWQAYPYIGWRTKF